MPDLFVEEASWVLAEEVYNNLSVHHEKNYKKVDEKNFFNNLCNIICLVYSLIIT